MVGIALFSSWLSMVEPASAAARSSTADSATPGSCDQDGDGFEALYCDGDDCDDSDADIHPGAAEVADDGIDQDCDGYDATEARWTGGGTRCGSELPATASTLLLSIALAIGRRRR